MLPKNDIRYAQVDDQTMAVSCDDGKFLAYMVGSENRLISISMEILVGIYPEVSKYKLTRYVTPNQNGDEYAGWTISDKTTDVEDQETVLSWEDLQERIREVVANRDTHRDLIKTLESAVDKLDVLISKPSKPKAWANVLLPIIEAMVSEGMSIDDVLKASYKQLHILEKS